MKDYLLKMPKELHAKLKAAAALRGVTMMDFIIEAVKKELARTE